MMVNTILDDHIQINVNMWFCVKFQFPHKGPTWKASPVKTRLEIVAFLRVMSLFEDLWYMNPNIYTLSLSGTMHIT